MLGDQRDRLVGAAAGADDGEAAALLERAHEPVPEDRMVVGEHHADGHCTVVSLSEGQA